MSEFSNYLEEVILNTTLRGDAYAAGQTPHVALFTNSPGEDGSGNEALTSAFPAYTRLALTFSDPAGTNTTSNSAAVSFAPFDGGTAQEYTHIGIYDALTGGNLLYHTPMNYAKSLTSTDVLSFIAGSITVTIE